MDVCTRIDMCLYVFKSLSRPRGILFVVGAGYAIKYMAQRRRPNAEFRAVVHDGEDFSFM
jgi:hypothetical protein